MSAPNNFDWVSERAKCSLSGIFELFAVALEQDVASANKLMTGNADVVFEYKRDRKVISVARKRADVGGVDAHVSVHFVQSSTDINVKRGGKNLFSITPCLTAERECKMRVGDKEMDVWEVCRMALETLIFECYEN